MFSVVETSLHYRSSPSPSPHNNSTFQDASFSTYLKSKDPSEKPQENYLGCGVDDTEISIFDAQKYFSENSDPMKKQAASPHDVMSVPRLSSVSSTDGYGRNFRTRSFHATPTASSEASWNSQTGLLANPPGSVGISLQNFDDSKKRSSVARKWIFGRKCCCTGKKSVEVKEATTSDSEHGGPVMIGATENNNNVKSNFLYAKRDSYNSKQSPTTMSQRSSITNDILEIHQQKVVAPNSFPSPDPPRQQRISASGRPFVDGVGGFSFPILNNSNQVTKPGFKGIMSPLEDPPRDSLEVFQPMDNCPANAGQRYNPGSPVARVLNTDDDVGSDASSDLFEIESFSTQTTSYPMYRRRDSLDEAPTFNVRRFASANGLNLNTNSNNNGSIQYGRRSLDVTPTPSVAATECYAPSEVSIDWSVTTAEGFDRASVSASEMGSAAFLRQRLQEEAVGGGESGKKKGNGGGLLLMSCRQEKAVSVGPQPVKCVAAGEGAAIFPAQVGGRPPRANKPPLGSDHSARLSLAFAA